MKTAHPIDHAIVAVLFLVEGICWIINELAGFHAEPEIEDPRDTIAIEAPVHEPEAFIEPDLFTLTVKELRKQAQGLAKGVHLMRKAELVELLTAV